MQELASLYAMLANRGVLKPLRLRAGESHSEGTRLLSAEASFMVMDILRQHARPDEATGAQPAHLPVYWKTGTSWGFRDAWSAGVIGPYVLVVWIGNFDGRGNPAFIEQLVRLFFAGKIGLDDVPLFGRLLREGLVKEPTYLPPWAQDLSYLTSFMSYSAFLGECDLSVERRRYEDLISHAEDDLL